jgi:hypothetical protein
MRADATAMTRAPFHFTSCSAKCPTPPAAPLMSTVTLASSGTGRCCAAWKGDG